MNDIRPIARHAMAVPTHATDIRGAIINIGDRIAWAPKHSHQKMTMCTVVRVTKKNNRFKLNVIEDGGYMTWITQLRNVINVTGLEQDLDNTTAGERIELAKKKLPCSV